MAFYVTATFFKILMLNITIPRVFFHWKGKYGTNLKLFDKTYFDVINLSRNSFSLSQCEGEELK